MNLIKKIIAGLIEKLVSELAAGQIAVRKAFNMIKIPSLHMTAKPCRGAILIEFAICMPILIILLFYINDLVKIKRYYSQTEFVGQQMANILQNLAKKRNAAGETLKYEDLCHAASLAYLTMYPGTTMYSPTAGQRKHEFIHCPFFYIYYIQGTSEGKAKCLWGKGITTDRVNHPPWHNFHDVTRNFESSIVAYNPDEVTASSIYPTLKVEDDKPKIIIEPAILWGTGLMDKNGGKVGTARQAFGYHFVSPRRHSDLYFNSVVIFSPNAGFPEVRPDP
ncbi:MAG: pilus assembly protein [Alphaproteobacteria bacterium]|nr:pilus assembly protein [Alphaproteobacteria bacterium]